MHGMTQLHCSEHQHGCCAQHSHVRISQKAIFDRMQLASKPKLVRHAWVEACVSEGRRVDEGQYSVTALHVPLVERLQKKNTPTSGQQGRGTLARPTCPWYPVICV